MGYETNQPDVSIAGGTAVANQGTAAAATAAWPTQAHAVNGHVYVDGVRYEVKWAAIDITKGGGAGDKTIIAGVASKKLRILGIAFSNGNDNAIRFQSGTTTLIERMVFNKGEYFSENSGAFGYWVQTAVGEAFIMDIEKDEHVRGRLLYIEVP